MTCSRTNQKTRSRRSTPIGRVATLIIGVTLTLSGCAGAEDAPPIAEEADTQPVFGVSNSDVDILLTLGVPLFHVQGFDNVQDPALPDYLDVPGDIELIPAFPLSYERVAELAPPKILNSLADYGVESEKLELIAPTISYDGYGDDPWAELNDVAQDLGRAAEWDAYLASRDEAVAALTDTYRRAGSPSVRFVVYRADDEPIEVAGNNPQGSAPAWLAEEVGADDGKQAREHQADVSDEMLWPQELATIEFIFVSYDQNIATPEAAIASLRSRPGADPSVPVFAVPSNLHFIAPQAVMELIRQWETAFGEIAAS